MKQAENDMKTKEIKAKIAEGFIAVCLATLNVGMIRKKS
ncbi:hypothetical protein Pvag_1703 [Pantoea vagans C9-1]|nr:hypothetical protein Pvag_1703 [Pantoea vagans C9-1]